MVACARRVAGFGSGKGLASRSHRVKVAVCARASAPFGRPENVEKLQFTQMSDILNVLKIHKFTRLGAREALFVGNAP
jgi:hypothetical protein